MARKKKADDVGAMIDEKRPRKWAEEIMSLACKTKRRELFDTVPAHIKQMVMDHCQVAARSGK
jgi:hypothetical protein